MGRKRSGTRALLSRLFVRTFEPIQVYGSVHHLARVGGVSIFTTPREYAPADLVIPTRFAATAQYLYDHGRNVPGLFRIPGQTKTIASLRNHFQSHMFFDTTHGDETAVEVTVRLAALPSPSTLPYNINDVASLFKLSLGELHGGILGSLDVFESLKRALTSLRSHDEGEMDFRCKGVGSEEVNVVWVARVLCSVECAQRRNLIFAVFGLLASLKQDCPDPFSPDWSPSKRLFELPMLLQDRCTFTLQHDAEKMSSKAMGVVFAPLLLGNLTDEIKIDCTTSPRSSRSAINTRRRSITGGKIHRSASLSHIKRHSISTLLVPVTNLEHMAAQQLESSNTRAVATKSTGKSWLVGRVKVRNQDHCTPRELGEGVERNRIACWMVESLIRHWEDVVLCLRDVGLGRADGWRMERSESDGSARTRWRPGA